MRKRRVVQSAVLAVTGIALVAGVTTLASAAPSAQTAPVALSNQTTAPKPTIVLVNGAWSDSASWSRVVKPLQAAGYPVVAPPTALRSLSGDSAYLAAYLKTIQGPIVLVGQSYGGSVITSAATGNPNVKALVYVSAFAPDTGESAGALTARFPGSHISNDPNAPVPTALSPVPVPFPKPDGTPEVVLYAKAAQYRDLFLSDRLSVAAAAELAATQNPVASAALGENTAGEPAWKKIPSWYLVSDADHLIPPAAERFMATRAHSHIVEADTPHAAQVTNPGIVVNLIERAVAGTR
ncbi:alpha/beta fold hydrolase [Kribbella pratensis]|uniref:Pimeloyl-ACP methyl ester carboxylesterase n=1 Tax=Kribbella pratensis TaxID=2512112 RepID=A0A4R8CP32_9ACTN|nr:alpha/beta hydrolase [Kribbella pratensis]TDW77884.1 pimeloyl-ACP methyl ester carboxylesterase [Kribbella pratensis]